jgi:hypothetical protein
MVGDGITTTLRGTEAMRTIVKGETVVGLCKQGMQTIAIGDMVVVWIATGDLQHEEVLVKERVGMMMGITGEAMDVHCMRLEDIEERWAGIDMRSWKAKSMRNALLPMVMRRGEVLHLDCKSDWGKEEGMRWRIG